MSRFHYGVPIALLCLLTGCATTEATKPAAAPTATSVASPAPAPMATAPTYDIGRVAVRPVPRVQVQPAYPKELRKKGVQGSVVVDFVVDTDGNVYAAKAVRSSNGAFSDAAIEAVSKWKFLPARVNDQPVNCHLQVPIVFTLENDMTPTARTNARLSGTADVFKLDEVEILPRVIRQIQPIYPLDLRRVGIQGEAVVEFVVAKDGTVASARAASATNAEFGEAAVIAVGHWRFKPAQRGGEPVNCQMQVPIVFSLNNR